MGLIKTAVLGLIVLYVISIFLRSNENIVTDLPNIWWGPGVENKNVDKTIRPFKVVFKKEDIDDLKRRLNNTRLPKPSLEGVAWTYGLPGQFLPKIIDNWLNKYDFKKREDYINKYPQFLTNIQGLDIHFLHVKPKDAKNKKVLPLLTLHGWPGSVMEFYKIIPLLTTPRPEYDFVFEVIVPSLPGFGFSSPAVRPGLGPFQIGVVLKNLMLRLGFEKFYTQGGDWGASISSNMARAFPQHILGIHSNLCMTFAPWTLFKVQVSSYFLSFILSKEDYDMMYPLSKKFPFELEATGYFHIQATKPDTIGAAQSDSPIGMAAYILEKFSGGTDPKNILKDDGALFEKFTPEELIDNLMLYWIPNTMTTAMRIYAEFFKNEIFKAGPHTAPVNVPTACAQFRHEISYLHPYFLKDHYKNLIRATKFPRGGHFAAFEEPQLLADDVWISVKAFEEIRKNIGS